MTIQAKQRFLSLSVTAALCCTLAGCKLREEKKANENVAQSNELFDEARTLYKKADAIKAEAVEADEEGRKKGGKKCKEKYDEAIEKVEEAAALMKDGSKLNITKEFSEYLSVKAKNLEKIGEGLGAHAKMCVALTKEPDEERLAELVEEGKAAFAEAKELSDEADEILEANQDQFEE